MPADRCLASPPRTRVTPGAVLAVSRLAAQQWGVLSTAELLACGLTHPAITRHKRRGWLHPLYVGVWAVGHPRPPRPGLLLAAVKACGTEAVLSHRSAAEHWGLIDSAPRRSEVTVTSRYVRRHPGILVHRTSILMPQDRLRREAVPVTSAVRTVVDLAALLREGPPRAALRRAQGLRLLDLRHLMEALDRLGPRRGRARLTRLVADGVQPTRSVLEDVVLDLILGAGFAHPDVNKPLIVDGRRLVPDFGWPHERLVLEADGEAWHHGELAAEADGERQALLEAAGERILRVTWRQATGRRAETIARLRAAGAPAATDR